MPNLPPLQVLFVSARPEHEPYQPLVRRVAQVVWSRHFPHRDGRLTVLLCPDLGERGDLGRYVSEYGVMALGVGTLRDAYGPRFVRYLILAAAHEAMHHVQHARGDYADRPLEAARSEAQYAESPAEAEANLEAMRALLGFFPGETGRCFNGECVPEDEVGLYRRWVDDSDRSLASRLERRLQADERRPPGEAGPEGDE